jgi:hypothetical protein
MDTAVVLAVASLIAGFVIGLSGWGTIWYQHWIAKPRISGSILTSVVSQLDDENNKDLTCYLCLVAVSNRSQFPTLIVDYELTVIGSGMERKIKRPYMGPALQHLNWSSPQGTPQVIPRDRFLEHLGKLSYGDSVRGVALFTGDPSLHNVKPDLFRLTLIDVFGTEHVVECRVKDLRTPRLLDEYLGMDITGNLPVVA